MDALLKVKEEPLDVDEHHDFEASLETQIKESQLHVKTEMDDFDVVDEQADMITVSMGDIKSEDERIFMEMLQNKSAKHPSIVVKKRTSFPTIVPSKRCKVERAKQKRESEMNFPSISVGEIQIKQELPDYESLIDNDINKSPSKCNIKTERQDDSVISDGSVSVKVEPEYVLNGQSTLLKMNTNMSKLNGTLTSPIIRVKALPLQPVMHTNLINASLKMIPNLRIVQLPARKVTKGATTTTTATPLTTATTLNAPTATTTITNLKTASLQLQNRVSSSLPINFRGLKIVKLAANTKIINLPGKPTSVLPMISNNNNNKNSYNNNVIITPKMSSDIMNSGTNGVLDIKPNIMGRPFNLSTMNGTSNFTDSLIKNVCIDVEKSAPISRNLMFQKEIIKVIESLPGKQEIIQTMRKQIETVSDLRTKNVITGLGSTCNVSESSQENSQSSSEHTDSDTVAKAQSAEPPNLFLPITSTCDPELWKARKEFPNYRFVWLCPNCARHYEQKHAFRGHLVTAHGLCSEEFQKLVIEVRPFLVVKKSAEESQRTRLAKHTCNACGRVCSSRTMLNDHVRANCGREPIYQCLDCPKKFYSASTLNCHMTIHSGELPHKCNYCDKRFRTRGQVTVHHRTHTGERPFMCQVCSQGFTHRETLISHLSRHIGMKRYKCYGCEKHFSCISGLKTHRDLRPDTCGKVKFNPRAIGPRVRVVRGNVIFEPQPEINAYLRSDDPQEILNAIENQKKELIEDIEI